MADGIDIFSKTDVDDAAACHRDHRFQITGRCPTAAANAKSRGPAAVPFPGPVLFPGKAANRIPYLVRKRDFLQAPFPLGDALDELLLNHIHAGAGRQMI